MKLKQKKNERIGISYIKTVVESCGRGRDNQFSIIGFLNAYLH